MIHLVHRKTDPVDQRLKEVRPRDLAALDPPPALAALIGLFGLWLLQSLF
tara:strand:- start:456 stop:605 length:150 start_codon:yes stop_codon:yes gene_type:complete